MSTQHAYLLIDSVMIFFLSTYIYGDKIQNRQKMHIRRELIILHFFFSDHLRCSLSSCLKMFIDFLVLLSLIWLQIIYKYPIIHSDCIHFIGRQDIEQIHIYYTIDWQVHRIGYTELRNNDQKFKWAR